MARKTHELALCGVLCALAVAFLWLSGVLPLSTYFWPILASSVLLIAREECRASYAWSCFAASAILGLLLCADKEASLVFCFLGLKTKRMSAYKSPIVTVQSPSFAAKRSTRDDIASNFGLSRG